ncbi:MAG TPA: 4a-hydroxytetrahydrobiopterin dehydratase, partial [Thermoanaerobaculia bacterium]|nr:4a-hydroxytetrahydrobiopterin dehydratase [Thermoanaerobaculia bacterium]
MAALADQPCVPCRGGVPPLAGQALLDLAAQLEGGWEVVDGHHLEKEFRFPNFREAMAFANRVGELAESVNHHPDLHVAWGKVKVVIWTHKIGGLSETDFVFAAKVD